MTIIDEFFFETNRVEGITEADYQRAQPYIEAAQAFAQSTYQSIYIIDYFRKNFLYVSDNPLFLCGHTADEVRQKLKKLINEHNMDWTHACEILNDSTNMASKYAVSSFPTTL